MNHGHRKPAIGSFVVLCVYLAERERERSDDDLLETTRRGANLLAIWCSNGRCFVCMYHTTISDIDDALRSKLSDCCNCCNRFTHLTRCIISLALLLLVLRIYSGRQQRVESDKDSPASQTDRQTQASSHTEKEHACLSVVEYIVGR